MTSTDRHLILLGPQPKHASLQKVLLELELRSPVALITAGWETEENQDHELQRVIGIDALNLNLFGRTEQLFADDPELIQGLQARQDELRHLRDDYNERLHLLLQAARKVAQRNDKLIDWSAERESSIEMIRQLDRQHFQHSSRVIDDYENQLKVSERPLVIEHRQQLAELMERCNALLIAGGHVAIILNRLQIFGILDMRPDLLTIAWSGGAMALAEQVVFFHDSPPQGQGDAEVLRAGMGLFADILPLPDARSRLNLDNRSSVELFSRRFGHFQNVVFDEQTRLDRKRGRWQDHSAIGAVCLGDCGRIVDFKA